MAQPQSRLAFWRSVLTLPQPPSRPPDGPGLQPGGFAARSRWLVFSLALAMLGLAVFAAWSLMAGGSPRALAAAVSARFAWWHVPVLVGVPLANWWLSSLVFWLLTRRVGAVGLAEMAALLGLSLVLNYAPLKPGLLGRMAYHRLVNRMPLPAVALTVLQAVLASAAGVAVTLAAAAVFAADEPVVRWVCLVGVLGFLAVGVLAGTRLVRADLAGAGSAGLAGLAGTLCACAAIRVVETLLWAVRYAVALWLLGVELSPAEALVLSAVSQAASLLPVQVGTREWAVGFAAAVMPAVRLAPAGAGAGSATAGLTGGLTGGLGAGLTADLLCRGADVLAALPAAAWGWWWMHQRHGCWPIGGKVLARDQARSS